MGSVFLFPSETMIGPWSWSKCSSQKIGELINQGLGNCMMRRTREFSVRSPTLIQPHTLIYTGRTHISPDVQCKLGEFFFPSARKERVSSGDIPFLRFLFSIWPCQYELPAWAKLLETLVQDKSARWIGTVCNETSTLGRWNCMRRWKSMLS